MKQKFIVRFTNHPKIAVTLIYKRGKLSEIKGIDKLDYAMYDWITRIAPLRSRKLDKDCTGDLKKLKGLISYTEDTGKDKALVFKVRGKWFDFFEGKFGIKPKYGATQGKAINGIIAYLRTLSSTEQEVYEVFCSMLDRWDELDTFTQSKCELTYINSKISSILVQLKDNVENRSI